MTPPNPGGGALIFLAPPNPGGGAFVDEGVFIGPSRSLAVDEGAAEVDADAVKERKLALIGFELGPSEGKSSPDCAAACGVGFEGSRPEDEDDGLLVGLDLLGSFTSKANPGITVEISPLAASFVANFGGGRDFSFAGTFDHSPVPPSILSLVMSEFPI